MRRIDVKVYVCYILLFLLQYFILPSMITVYPSDKYSIVMLFLLTTITVFSVFEFAFQSSLLDWALSSAVYVVIVFLFHPEGLYGIGTTTFVPAFVTIMSLCALVVVSSFITIISIKAIKLILCKRMNRHD